MTARARVRPSLQAVDVIGVPSSLAAFAPGQERAPAAMRSAGLIAGLLAAGIDVLDRGDAPTRRWLPDRGRPDAQNATAIASVLRETSARVATSLSGGRGVVVLGGDCTVGIGALAGCGAAVPGRVGLLYFDLHPDMNVPASMRGGALDWTGVGHALGLPGAVPEIVEFGSRVPLLMPNELWLFGYGPDNRTDFERGQMASLAIAGTTVDEVGADPVGAAHHAMSSLAGSVDRVLLHFDVDVIDFVDLPLSENTGRNEGLPFEPAITALATLCEHPAVIGLSICEVNPDHDPDGSSVPRLVDGLVRAISRAGAPDSRRRAQP